MVDFSQLVSNIFSVISFCPISLAPFLLFLARSCQDWITAVYCRFVQVFNVWIFLPNGIEYRIRFDVLILFVLIILVYVIRVNLFVSFLKKIQIKSYLFSTAKDTKKHLFFFVSFCFTYISFFLFLMPCFHKAASCSLGMQEAKLV